MNVAFCAKRKTRGGEKNKAPLASLLFWLFHPRLRSQILVKRTNEKLKTRSINRQQHKPQEITTVRTWTNFNNVRLSTAKIRYICYSLGGPYWEKLCPRSWVPRAQFLPIQTNLGRWITFLFFFLLRFKSFRKVLLQPPTYLCWRRAR